MDKIVSILITPVAKPRMTRSDMWKKRPVVLKYQAFCDELRLNVCPEDIPEEPDITFYMPMPCSWSKKKKASMDCKPHRQTPDLDNLIKAVLDAMFTNDAHIWSFKARKLWGFKGMIEIKKM